MPRFLSSLEQHKGVCSAFIGRIQGVELTLNKDEVLDRLQPAHEQEVSHLGFCWDQLHLAEQVHGSKIVIVTAEDARKTWPEVDGLMTSDVGVLLGIYVADCGAVYLHDPVRRVVALLHSGKKGTEGDITGKAIQLMQDQYGSSPADIQVVLSPCIKPPFYEIDFGEDIRQQALSAGILEEHYMDANICTASNVGDYYSYRQEKGKTGRMLALLGMV
ncbi:MAG: polyphenol oxidase family protein [Akkermansiaceae bacterium]|nr:polyphenol oxidase family protein [Akkermansiaceae bacterium]